MNRLKRIAFVFGTRPEAIKLCPLVRALQDHPFLEAKVCVTGQHREMLQQMLDLFEIVPDVDLELMTPNQALAGLTSRAIADVDRYFSVEQPEMVIVQGDTTTTFCAALSAFYRRIPVGHVEAGLRTWNKFSPFPEEINRTLTSKIADLHFAPTEAARSNLLNDQVAESHIIVTGNTVIDALLMVLEKVKESRPRISNLPDFLQPGTGGEPSLVLVTGHRRENFGSGLENICRGIAELAARFPDTHFVYPVHLNPNVGKPVNRIIGDKQFGNVHLLQPLGYLEFVGLMERSTLILTDSGGIQEEAPSLGKPVLVMRDTTERPEAVEMGTAKLIGSDARSIVDHTAALLTDGEAYASMADAGNPFGDGRACDRIITACESYLLGDPDRK